MRALHLLPLLPLVACAAPPTPVEIPFVAHVHGAPLSCAAEVPLGDAPLRASTLLLYVHDLRLVDAAGAETPLALDQDGRWQHQGTALLDFEDGQGACRNGSAETHTRIRATAPAGDYVALRMRLGVPFELNHGDPVHAPAALAGTTMSWGWQGGMKFLRLEGRWGGRPLKVHLGSTGCRGEIGAISGCSRPNRPEVEVAPFEPGETQVGLDLGRLVEGLAVLPEATCMGGAAEAGCGPVFAALGLDLVSGAAAAPAPFVEAL